MTQTKSVFCPWKKEMNQKWVPSLLKAQTYTCRRILHLMHQIWSYHSGFFFATSMSSPCPFWFCEKEVEDNLDSLEQDLVSTSLYALLPQLLFPAPLLGCAVSEVELGPRAPNLAPHAPDLELAQLWWPCYQTADTLSLLAMWEGGRGKSSLWSRISCLHPYMPSSPQLFFPATLISCLYPYMARWWRLGVYHHRHLVEPLDMIGLAFLAPLLPFLLSWQLTVHVYASWCWGSHLHPWF